jgi:hypothetical protein
MARSKSERAPVPKQHITLPELIRIDIRKRRPETVGTFSEHAAETGNTSLAE